MITDNSSLNADFLHFQKAVVKPNTYTKTGMKFILNRLQKKYSIRFPKYSEEGVSKLELREMLNFFYYEVVIKNGDKNKD